MALSDQQEQLIHEASRNAILQGFERIQQYWQDAQWLPDENFYKKNCIERLRQDFSNGQANGVSLDQLVDYIAASTIIHCFDGWSFLGRALDAELSGDSDTARHLGYYAELRAAMSLLAGHGIGVFDNKHIVIKSDNRCYLVPKNAEKRSSGTHQFSWEALQLWADSTSAVKTLFESIFPGGIPLKEWLNYYPGRANFVASHWLRQWGLDISRLSKDRDARNISSYRPTAFMSAGSNAAKVTFESICRLWELCEPRSDGGFQVMDRHLLKSSIQRAFKQKIKDGSIEKNIEQYQTELRAILSRISPRDLTENQWQSFLSDLEIHPVLSDADGDLAPSEIGHSRQVLSRALLLLRIATGSASALLKESGASDKGKLAFWWSNNSVCRRLWSPENQPDSFSDLWEDISEAKDGLLSVAQPNDVSYHRIWNNHGALASMLSTTERVALWGLCL